MASSGFVPARVSRMNQNLEQHVGSGAISGAVALVSRRGETHVEVVGTSAIGSSHLLQRDSIFRISSMTKPITAAAAMILIEECRLRLDEPIDRWLPELSQRRVLRRINGPLEDVVPANRPITVRDLLTFRLGFGIVMAAPGTVPIVDAMAQLRLGQGPPAPSIPPAPDEWIHNLGRLPLMHQPGERWMYGTGSDVLGVLIARVSGQPFDVFLRERIFEPLGMRDTAFYVPVSRRDRFVTSYWTNFQSGALEHLDAPDGQWSKPPAFPSGSAGLVSTADDFLAFAEMLMGQGRRGSVRILSRASVELMTSDQLTPAQKAVSGLVQGFFEDNGWGFGVSMVTRRRELFGNVGTYGWDGGMGTSWANDPVTQLTGILLTQSAWVSPVQPLVCRDFWTTAAQMLD